MPQHENLLGVVIKHLHDSILCVHKCPYPSWEKCPVPYLLLLHSLGDTTGEHSDAQRDMLADVRRSLERPFTEGSFLFEGDTGMLAWHITRPCDYPPEEEWSHLPHFFFHGGNLSGSLSEEETDAVVSEQLEYCKSFQGGTR